MTDLGARVCGSNSARARWIDLRESDESWMCEQSLAAPRGHYRKLLGDGVRAALALGAHLAWRGGRISEHDALIGRRIAHVLAGGAPHPTVVSEQRLLDLEREAFLSLCGEPLTQQRIAYTLKTGKTLRN